jgi:hypothetical protein
MKINHVISEHKKGIKAVKYNKKPQDPAAAHAKAKEKLKPIKPMEGYNINGVDAQHERELKAHHKAELKKKADAGDENAKKRLQALHDKEQARRDEFNARMERESIQQENRWGRRDFGYDDSGMSLRPGNDEGPDSWDYSAAHDRIGAGDPRPYRNRQYQQQADVPHDVHINGRKWKTFGSKSHAENVARKLAANGKTVHVKASLTDEAAGDPVGTVQSATPDGKVVIKTDSGVVNTDKDALMPGATPQDPLQMKPDAAGGALKPGAKVVSTAEDILPPPADSQSPIHGGTVHGDEGRDDSEHNEIIQLLKRLAHRDGIDEADVPTAAAPAQPAAAPGADIDPGEEILNIASNNPEVKNFIEASTVRDADGDVDFAGTMGKMMTSASEQMDIKGIQDAVVQMEAKFKAFPASPEFKALTPEEQQEWTKAAPECLKLMQDLVAQFAKMQQAFAAGGKQATNFSQSPDAPKDNFMKGVKSFIPQKPAPAPAPTTEDTQLLQKMLTIAGLR